MNTPADRVKETTTTTGTGDITLLGAASQFVAFQDVFSPSDTVSYAIVGQSGTEWEVGSGTLVDATTLARTTVQASSNGGSAVNFSAGTKDVFVTVSATDLVAMIDRSNHTGVQAISTVTGLQTALDGKAASSHTHAAGDITGLATSATTDTTNADNITSGTLSSSRLAANVPLEDAANNFTTNGAASTPSVTISGSIFTGGTGTTTVPLCYLNSGASAPTSWSTAGTILGFNAQSGFTGNFLDFHVNGGASVAIVSGAGTVAGTRVTDINGTMGIWGGTISIANNRTFGFSSTTGYTGTLDAGLARNAAGVVEVNSGTIGTFRDIKARTFISDSTVRLKGYTVATLPSGATQGDTAYVTDATTPTYLGALTGGGAVVCPVFYNGTAWVSA